MQTLATFLLLGRLAASLFISGSLVSLSTNTVAQTINKHTVSSYDDAAAPVRTQTVRLTQNGQVLARNTSSKPAGTIAATPAPPVQKKQDLKTVGRCWNRLMVMIREARQTHRRGDE